MNFGKNLVISTWGKNENGETIWYPSFYDCDSILGLANNGKITFGPGLDMDTGDYNTSNSALWTKLKNNFGQEIRDRYRELRMPRTINGKEEPPMFSSDNFMRYFGGQVTETIGQSFYNKDAELKYLIPESKQWIFMCSGDRRQYTERWIRERIHYMDSIYEFENYINSRIVLRSNVVGRVRLLIKTYSPQHILISFSDSSAAKIKQYVDKDRWYAFEYDIANGRDNNIYIAGAFNVMYVQGIETLNASFVNIGQANKLVELDCSYSSYIQQIALADNPYLQSVKCNNCPNLGMKLGDKVLDLEKCINLRYLDCSNTKIGSVRLNSKGGVLEYLNCSSTELTSFNIAGQEYLTELALDNCKDLAEITVDNCNSLNRVSLPNSKISKFIITGCDKLTYVDISQTKFLTTLDLRGCPKLNILKMKGVSNQALTEINLSNALELEHLDISSTSYLKHIVFGKWTENGVTHKYNKLKHFIAESSTIESIRFGITEPTTNGLDFSGFTLDTFNIKNCTEIQKVTNLNLYATRGIAPFYGCKKLSTITGTIDLCDGIGHAFYDCQQLSVLPNLILNRVTNAYMAFLNCTKFTMSHVSQIMAKFSDKLTGASQIFAGCSMAGTIPANLFSKCPNLIEISHFFNNKNVTGTIPPNLFANCTKLVNVNYLFTGASITGAVPPNLFANCPKITNVDGLLSETKISEIPTQEFFRTISKTTSLLNFFRNCKDLYGEISDRLLIPFNNLASVTGMFEGCTGIMGSIPENLFNNINRDNNSASNKIKWAERTFKGAGFTGGIPERLFESCHLLENVKETFRDSNLTEPIPNNLFLNNNRITTMYYTFAYSKITGEIPKNIFKGKTLLLNITALFAGCTELIGDIPKGLLDDCDRLTDISSLFYGCRGLSGQIPKRVSTFIQVPNPDNPDLTDEVEVVEEYGIFDKCRELVNAASVFNGCSGLRSEIPETLLISAHKVVDLSNMFANCSNLYGPIPKKLFDKCYNAQNLSGFFRGCSELSEYIIDEENPYCMPEELFYKCPNLTDVSSFVSLISTGKKFKGAIPPTLFSRNTKLTSCSNFLAHCTGITGEIPSSFFSRCSNIENTSGAFSLTAISVVGVGLLNNNPRLKNVSNMFESCGQIISTVPELWKTPATSFAKCYAGCTKAANYEQIPSTWK